MSGSVMSGSVTSRSVASGRGCACLVSEARALLLDGRVVEAVRLYCAVLSASPPADAHSLFEANNNIGVCYYVLRRHSEALDVFNAAILVRLRREVRAAAAQGRAAGDEEGYLEPIYNKGLSFIEVGYYENALKAFQCCLEQSSETGGARAGVARCLLCSGREEAALAACDAMVAHSPRDAKGYMVRGYCLYKCGRADLAGADLRASLRLEDGPGLHAGAVLAAVLCDVSLSLLRDSEYSPAMAHLSEARVILDAISAQHASDALVMDPMTICRRRAQESLCEIRFNMAVALVGLGQLPEAMDILLEISRECAASVAMVRRAQLGVGGVAMALLVDVLAPMHGIGAVTTRIYQSAVYLKYRVMNTEEEQCPPTALSDGSAHPLALLQTCISVWTAADAAGVAAAGGPDTAGADCSGDSGLPVEDFAGWVDDAKNIEACLRFQLRSVCGPAASSPAEVGAGPPDLDVPHSPVDPLARGVESAGGNNQHWPIATLASKSMLCRPCAVRYPLQSLQSPGPYPLNVDVSRREEYLLNSSFEELFGMTKHSFRTLPKWKKIHMRKLHLLF